MRYISLYALFFHLLPALASLEHSNRCNPLQKDSQCPPNPGFARTAVFDFTTAHQDANFYKFWKVENGARDRPRQLSFNTDGTGLGMGILAAGDAPTLTSNEYLFFGEVTVEARAASGPGLITAIMLRSDSGNEILWELLGIEPGKVQTNYFYNGELLFNTYNRTYDLGASSTGSFHTYTLQYASNALIFSINGKLREHRFPDPSDIPAAKWPQTPMQVKIGLWSTNTNSPAGEKAWAGGVPDFGTAPFWAAFKSIQVKDSMGGCLSATGPVEYVYDSSFSGWESVKVKGCEGGRPGGGVTLHSSRTGEGSVATSTASAGADGTGSTSLPSSTTELDAPPQESDQPNKADRVGVWEASLAGFVGLLGLLLLLF